MLRAKRASFGDPMAETVPSHVTLIAPSEVEESELESFCRVLARAAAALPAYPMRLRGTGTFRPVSSVVFIAVSQGISYTEILAQHVRALLGFPHPPFPYHPHVTVAHNLDDSVLDRAYDELSDFECEFVVEQIALYQHEDDVGWVPQRTFPLGSAPNKSAGQSVDLDV